MSQDAQCIFCKIIDGKIPSMKLLETDKSFAFVGSLVIPKYHAAKMHELPDEYLADVMPVAKKVAIATGATEYNILQNNGRLAHQEQGLIVGWPSTSPSKEELNQVYEKLKSRLP